VCLDLLKLCLCLWLVFCSLRYVLKSKFDLSVFLGALLITCFIQTLYDCVTLFVNLILNLLILICTGNLFLVYLVYELSALSFVPLFLISVRSARVFWACHLLYIVISLGVLAFVIFVSLDTLTSSSISLTASHRFFISTALTILILLKVPAYPFYFWLPEAHVEAPWIGSVVLASIILKYSLYLFLIFGNVILTHWN
jgi:formate hydrogenlyase subunit 3/multisubunit Na+/H+ antiporter MnhD subunit